MLYHDCSATKHQVCDMHHLVVIAVARSTVRRQTALSRLACRRNVELKTERTCYSRHKQVHGDAKRGQVLNAEVKISAPKTVPRSWRADHVQARVTVS